MIEVSNREICELFLEDDFTFAEILKAFSSFWKFVVNILEWIENGVVTYFVTPRKILQIFIECDQCFHVNVAMETSCLLQSESSKCLKTSTGGSCPVDPVNRRAINRKNTDVPYEIYGELENINRSEASQNGKGGKVTQWKTESAHSACQSKGLTEMVTSSLKERVKRISRITFTDFTASFNQYVRQNGREFSKSELAWWFDKFTKYIYLKEVFHRQPTNSREQLEFRSIKSKRDSIMERLYMLRDKHEFHDSAEEFYRRLKSQSLDILQDLIEGHQCYGDSNEAKGEIIFDENRQSTEKCENEREIVSEDKDDNLNSASALYTQNTIRAETIDIEKEDTNVQGNVEDTTQQQTTTECRTKRRKKRRQKPQIAKQDNETKFKSITADLIGHLNGKEIVDPNIPRPRPAKRVPRNCLKSTIYTTKDGLVHVSQYEETSLVSKKNNSTANQQKRIITIYVDPVDETGPLPPNDGIKSLPPGGLEEVLCEEFSLLSGQDEILIHTHGGPEGSDRASKLQTGNQSGNYAKSRSKTFQATLKCPVHNPSYASQPLETETRQTCVKSRDLSETEPTEHHTAETAQPQTTTTTPGAQDDTSEIIVEHGDYRTEPDGDSKMRRFVPLEHSKKGQPETDIREKLIKESTDVQVKEVDRHEKKEEILKKHELFGQLPPLNFIDTDVENETGNITPEPVYLETNATIDYSRHVVEPSHGDRPNKKKLQAVIKEKIKTKGEANKHLKAKQARSALYFDETQAENVEAGDVDREESDIDKSATEETESLSEDSFIVSATDQPQVQDTREFMMVPEEIRRIDDPRLQEIEDKYSLGSNNAKKDKKKKKDRRSRVKMTVPLDFV